MVEIVSGTIASKSGAAISIESGAGMEISLKATRTAVAAAPEEGRQARIWAQQASSGSIPCWFGFGSKMERAIFSSLVADASMPPHVAFRVVDEMGKEVAGPLAIGRLACLLGIGHGHAARILRAIKLVPETPEEKTPTPDKETLDLAAAALISLMDVKPKAASEWIAKAAEKWEEGHPGETPAVQDLTCIALGLMPK